jgi:hypothetical protein
VASTWAFEAQGPGSIPGGGAISEAQGNSGAISEAKADGGAATNPLEIDFIHGLRDRDHSCSG